MTQLAIVELWRAMARRVIRNNFKNYYELVCMPHYKKQDIENIMHGNFLRFLRNVWKE